MIELQNNHKTGGQNSRRVSPYLALIPVAFGVFVAADDQTVMVTVLTEIMIDFRVPITKLDTASWTITAYLLGYVAAMPLIGRMSDAWGHRRVFSVAMVIFMIFSAFAAMAKSMEWLIAIRVFQAMAAGAMLPVAIAIVGDLFPSGKRGLALGLIIGAAEAGGVIGPLWGGLVARYLTWPWVFWMNIPLGIMTLIPLFMFLKPSPKFKSKVDYMGGILIALSLAALTLALSRIDRPDLILVLLFILTAVFLIGFIVRQKTADEPLLPNSMFASPTIVAANLSHLLVGCALIIGMVTIPFMTTTVMAQEPLEGGLRLMRMTIAMPIGAILGGIACQKMDFRIPALLGLILTIWGYYEMSGWSLSISDPLMSIPLVVTGFGFGILISPIALAATEPVSHGDRGAAAGVVTAMRLVGMTLGLAAITSWGSQRFFTLVSGLPLPIPAQGESSDVSLANIEAYSGEVMDIGMNLFTEFFIIAVVAATIALIPTIFMAWNHKKHLDAENSASVTGSYNSPSES